MRLSNPLKLLIPVQEIHVETIVNDVVYSKLLNFVRIHQPICLVIGPNEHFLKVLFGADSLEPNEYKNILKQRYSHLSKFVRIGLHTHLYHKYSLTKLDYDAQFKKMSEGKQFLESIGLKIIDFAPGWWNYDENTIKTCQKLGLTRFHAREKLYDLSTSKIEFIQVRKFTHDYDL